MTKMMRLCAPERPQTLACLVNGSDPRYQGQWSFSAASCGGGSLPGGGSTVWLDFRTHWQDSLRIAANMGSHHPSTIFSWFYHYLIIMCKLMFGDINALLLKVCSAMNNHSIVFVKNGSISVIYFYPDNQVISIYGQNTVFKNNGQITGQFAASFLQCTHKISLFLPK